MIYNSNYISEKSIYFCQIRILFNIMSWSRNRILVIFQEIF